MTAVDRLVRIQARADKATEGPWVVEDQAGTDLIVAPSGHAVAYNADDRDIGRPNSEFIAHARTDVPRLLAALRAVLDLHAESGGECQECVHPADSHWRVDYPCPTVRVVEAALGEGAS